MCYLSTDRVPGDLGALGYEGQLRPLLGHRDVVRDDQVVEQQHRRHGPKLETHRVLHEPTIITFFLNLTSKIIKKKPTPFFY